jgi:hypothetical protein
MAPRRGKRNAPRRGGRPHPWASSGRCSRSSRCHRRSMAEQHARRCSTPSSTSRLYLDAMDRCASKGPGEEAPSWRRAGRPCTPTLRERRRAPGASPRAGSPGCTGTGRGPQRASGRRGPRRRPAPGRRRSAGWGPLAPGTARASDASPTSGGRNGAAGEHRLERAHRGAARWPVGPAASARRSKAGRSTHRPRASRRA